MRRQIFPVERSDRLVEGGFATRSGDQIEYTAQGYKDSFLDGEEQVRADLYYDLVTDLGYAAGDIEFEKLHKIGHPHKKSDAKVDIVVKYPDDRPFMVVELKSPEEYEGYLESSIRTQLFNVAAVENQGHNSIQYLIYHTRDWVNDQLLEKTIASTTRGGGASRSGTPAAASTFGRYRRTTGASRFPNTFVAGHRT